MQGFSRGWGGLKATCPSSAWQGCALSFLMRFRSGFGVPNNHPCEAGLGAEGCMAPRPATGADNSTSLAFEQAIPHARFQKKVVRRNEERRAAANFGTVARSIGRGLRCGERPARACSSQNP